VAAHGFVVALVLALGACKKPAPPNPTKPASSSYAPPGSAEPSGGSGLASPTAFELTARARGATLVWGPRGAARPTLLHVELDASGRRTGSVSVVLDASARAGEISDLASAWVGERLAVAWIERSGAKARVRAAWASAKARVFELGAAWRGPPTARGNVVVEARRGKGLVFARGDEVGCIEPGKHACYAFSFHELAADRALPVGLSLSVPVPCTDNATSLVVLPHRYHYGVCTDTGRGPVTTMFTITPEPAYAQASPVLEGCEPAGTFAWKGDAWLVATCQGHRRAARLGGSDTAIEYLDMRSLRLECKGTVAALRTSGFELALDEPRSRLEALLPSAMAPRGSRAVWTGGALLVASTVGSALRLARYVCEQDRWDESSVDLD
jgi:hypothetical protein